MAYEEARDSGDFKKASELADALYFLQRMHSDRLNDLIAEYKPEPFSKAWGSDPEYIALSKQLNTMAETLDAVELTDSGTIGKKGKKGKKKWASLPMHSILFSIIIDVFHIVNSIISDLIAHSSKPTSKAGITS